MTGNPEVINSQFLVSDSTLGKRPGGLECRSDYLLFGTLASLTLVRRAARSERGQSRDRVQVFRPQLLENRFSVRPVRPFLVTTGHQASRFRTDYPSKLVS